MFTLKNLNLNSKMLYYGLSRVMSRDRWGRGRWLAIGLECNIKKRWMNEGFLVELFFPLYHLHPSVCRCMYDV